MVQQRSRDIWQRRVARMDDRVLIEGRLVAVEATSPHGTASTYGNWACRCAPCSTAHAAKMAEDRLARVASRRRVNGYWYATKARVHGSYSTYSNWHCRCPACVEAHRINRGERRLNGH